MNKLTYRLLLLPIAGLCLFGCIRNQGNEDAAVRLVPFEHNDVKLLEGPFKKATGLNIKSLLYYKPDRLLAKFRTEAGLMPKAEHYHGWEDNTIAGHSLGHYLSACALMYSTTGDKQFLERVNYIVDELDSCQMANGKGYIGAIPGGRKILETEVAKGQIQATEFELNGIWVPFYTYHKVMAGLRDAFQLCNNHKALEIEIRFADWVETVVKNLPENSIQEILRCEHGGINEVLAELYNDTGNEKYLNLSRIFHHKAILDSLLQEIDILPGKHANTQIPKLTGLARRYELTGDTSDRKTAEFFWSRVVNHHSYVTGGHGNHECFGLPDKLRNRLGPNTSESCNVYNMLKLTRHIFKWNATAEAADFYERALFNHILATQHPANGRVTYNLSLDMGGNKEYQDPFWFTCCVGTGMENHSKYGSDIYYHNNKELYINQFIASELTWKEKGMVLIQKTMYPEEQGASIFFNFIRPVKLSLMVRYPGWAKNGIVITVNGLQQNIEQQPGSFIKINRIWNNGDIVTIKIPFSIRLEAMPDDSKRLAVLYGPLVLAGDLGPEDDPNVSDIMYVPVIITQERDPAYWTEPIKGKVNEFITKGVGKPRDIQLKPFYKTHERQYSVYWDIYTQKLWEKKQSDYKTEIAKKKKLIEVTIDFVQPGDTLSEKEHNFKGEITNVGQLKGKSGRESHNGWFSYNLNVKHNKPVALVVEYRGGYPGARIFDILIDNTVIATENISSIVDNRFVDIQYEIPEKLTRGKKKITVKFQAINNNTAGPVFGVRTVTL